MFVLLNDSDEKSPRLYFLMLYFLRDRSVHSRDEKPRVD